MDQYSSAVSVFCVLPKRKQKHHVGICLLSQEAKMTTVTDLSPRWIVRFKRETDTFVLPFNDLGELITAVYHARALGYKIKTLPAKGYAQ
mgnify:CR=1 FL=1